MVAVTDKKAYLTNPIIIILFNCDERTMLLNTKVLRIVDERGTKMMSYLPKIQSV